MGSRGLRPISRFVHGRTGNLSAFADMIVTYRRDFDRPEHRHRSTAGAGTSLAPAGFTSSTENASLRKNHIHRLPDEWQYVIGQLNTRAGHESSARRLDGDGAECHRGSLADTEDGGDQQ